MITKAEWLPVIGWESWYEVSNIGQVRRARAGPSTSAGRILSTGISSKGYPQISLYADDRRQTFKVHHLVAAAFIGICPSGKEINHRDGDKFNNNPSNLEYVTHGENVAHAVTHGLTARGKNHGSVKLTKEDVLLVRDRTDESPLAAARRLGVTDQTIRDIRSRRTWAWLPQEA